MTSSNERSNAEPDAQSPGNTDTSKGKVTHNLDTGEDEPIENLEDESVMDFGSGSGGGSGGDGGAS
jgi:hypothetical protein